MAQDSAGLSYIDENFRYYSTRGTPTPNDMNRQSITDAHTAPLVSNAADLHGATRRRDLGTFEMPHSMLGSSANQRSHLFQSMQTQQATIKVDSSGDG